MHDIIGHIKRNEQLAVLRIDPDKRLHKSSCTLYKGNVSAPELDQVPIDHIRFGNNPSVEVHTPLGVLMLTGDRNEPFRLSMTSFGSRSIRSMPTWAYELQEIQGSPPRLQVHHTPAIDCLAHALADLAMQAPDINPRHLRGELLLTLDRLVDYTPALVRYLDQSHPLKRSA